MEEKRYRTLIKTISWRITGTIDTFLVAYLITGKIGMAASIGGVEVFTKLFLYYWHERAWNKINYGKTKPKEPEYFI
ncbi:DUF2061 domain-containing protein [Saccharicrinis fermentans]|uniref:DUF2061 domain-containing protein n=1 Tax=Saccharicrinis fermentans DSM 9555 = JCM 21142 TaxID=869213 RepID=W7YKG6_9BACT|nr:DUF2061 domain-containing protein [Saccharicrinis fermentans]GAF02849.1 hypothetical protein JCM21142_41494 [Saccharicrinis fermentans DSM 9555 = JCM 21142]